MTRARRIAAAALVAAFLVGCQKESGQGSGAVAESEPPAWSIDRRREWASALAADGLDDQALAIYEEIVREPRGLGDAQRVGISLTIAELHMKKGRFEEALASLYRAKLFKPEGETARRIEEKRIQCFERLGRSSTADRILAKATAADPKAPAASGDGAEALAKIGDDVITRADFDAVLASMPPEVRAQIGDKEQKTKLLRSIVAQRVLTAKAKKLGLDSDAKVRLAMQAASDEILVRKLVGDEITGKVKIAPEEIELYYKAHLERFRDPAELTLAQIVVDGDAAEKAVRDDLASGKSFEAVAAERSTDEATKKNGGKIEAKVVEGRFHADFVNVADVFAAVGATKAGAVAEKALVTTSGRRILKVLERVEAVQKPLEEVKADAERMLRGERERAAFDAMMKDAVEQKDVTIHADKL